MNKKIIISIFLLVTISVIIFSFSQNDGIEKSESSEISVMDKKLDEIIKDKENNEQSEKVILCTGKVYYDLLEYQVKHNLNVPLIRVEQLYPLPDIELKTILEKYIQCEKFIWCQEEPMNQGAWFVLRSRMNACLPKQKQLTYVGRDATASPAVGYYNRHLEEQVKLVEDAFNV